ncbi:MFS transporter [Aquincola sp. MAHUQ-54]|uniref:MFS transporter n=1 Tax=Aquincola agrisoli TaxID=3119538 RepID=A0AAW9QCK8_9BURK
MQPLPLVIILLVLDHVAFNGSRIAVSLTAIHQGASALTVGLLMASYALLPALLAVPAGRWVDRIGAQRPMLIGSAGLGIGCLLAFALPNLAALYATSVIIGLSFMLINVAAYHAVGFLSVPEQRTANFSFMALGFSTSSFIAPLLTGLSIDQLGHRFSFAVLGLFTVLPAAVLALAALPETRSERAAGAGGQRPAMFDLLRDPYMRRLFIAIAVLTVAWDIYTFAMPVYGTQIGLSASQIGIVMGSFAAASFVARLVMPMVARRVQPWPLIAASMMVAGLSYAAVPFSHGVGALMAAMFMLGLSLGAPHPMVLTLLHHAAPEGRAGEAVGLRTMFINTSQTALPLVFGLLGTALGMAPLFLAMTAALFGGGAMARRMARRPRAS